jgi:hypothetical protein
LSVLASVGNSFQRAYVSSNNLFASRGSPCLKASFDTNSGESEAQREFFESLKHLSEKTSMDAPPGPHNASALQELHRESRQRAIDSLQELEIMKATMQREHSGLHGLGMHTQDPQTLSLEEQFPRRGGGAGASSALPGDAGLQLGMDYSYLLEGGAQPQPSQESGGDLVRQLEATLAGRLDESGSLGALGEEASALRELSSALGLVQPVGGPGPPESQSPQEAARTRLLASLEVGCLPFVPPSLTLNRLKISSHLIYVATERTAAQSRTPSLSTLQRPHGYNGT